MFNNFQFKNECIECQYIDQDAGLLYSFVIDGDTISMKQAGILWTFSGKYQHYSRKIIFQCVHPGGIKEQWIALPKNFFSEIKKASRNFENGQKENVQVG